MIIIITCFFHTFQSGGNQIDKDEVKTVGPSLETAEDLNVDDLELDSRQSFEESKAEESQLKTAGSFIEINTNPVPVKETKLESIDMSYFLLTLACSANIGLKHTSSQILYSALILSL